MNQPARCPSCRQTMLAKKFPRNTQGEVELDFCFACQGIWFDEYESVQIAPGGVIDLFKLLHEHRDEPRQPLAEPLACPRCNEKLLHGLDVAKHGGQFNYHRCLQKHGRFITFAQFMTEKGFVRQLNPVEINELAARVGTINCSGCGAPVDIRKDHACGHCRAPIAILDPQAVEQALARYQAAEVKRTAPPDVDMMADAILMREKEKSRRQREKRISGEVDMVDVVDLFASGIEAAWRLIGR